MRLHSAIKSGVAGALALIGAAANAQHSDNYTFIKGVRDADFAEVQTVLDRPGVAVIDTRDQDTGEGALHIVTRRRDDQWLIYLLRREANPNLRDRDGNTALHIAARIGFPQAVHWLTVVRADVNAKNSRGETPLIIAVQQRNAEVVRQLLAAGADPDATDGIVGMSARDYAARDDRAGSIRALLDNAQTPARTGATVGPTP